MSKKPQYPSDKQDQFMVRLPDGMRDTLKEVAENKKRSMNAEIVARLEDFPKLQQKLFETSRENAKLADDKDRLEHELSKLTEIKKRFFEKDGSEKPVLTIPKILLDRIGLAAAKNRRTIDAEAMSALEAAYPQEAIDINLLAAFLNSLVMPFYDDPDRADYERYLEEVNDMLAGQAHPWTIKSDPLGPVAFYPYASPKPPSDKSDEE